MKYFETHPKEFDETISDDMVFEVYPVIVLSDVLALTPLLPMLFQKELENRLSSLTFKRFKVNPITLIHIQDLERLVAFSENHKVNIWEILKANFDGSLLPRPFNITLNRLSINPTNVETITNELAEFIGLKKDE